MAKKSKDFATMSTKKKSRMLFWGMLAPLLTITIVACSFFYYMSNAILEYYVRSELSYKLKEIDASVNERMDPIIVNVENFSNFASLTDDKEILNTLLVTLSKNLTYSSSFYYTTIIPRNQKGGYFIESSGWIPDADYDPSQREWYKNAIAHKGSIAFTNPFVDVITNKLAVTISLTVPDEKGKTKGVVACDILLDQLLEILKDIELSPHGKIYLISHSGLYLTHEDPSKIQKDNFFNHSNFNGDRRELLDGKTKSILDKKNYYSVSKIGISPWFVITEGPLVDYKGRVANTVLLFEIALVIFSIFTSTFNIRTIRKMRKNEQELGAKLFEETQNLVVAAKENAATSQDQSAAVKEIVATMEDSNALSENISSKIHDVSKVAEKTSSDVAEGVASIEQNVMQLHSIFDANQQTIDGMKILSERIESIWDIVTLINNIADQAKIIAFNAELEASSAGEAGRSFRIVANEIRRLSDSIIDGTKEIKERITEIQHSSDSLILASETGTEKINEGYENAKGLKEKFSSIKNSAEVTAASAGDITDIIQQQTTASEQILIALKQISAGVENFTVATDNISASSEHIQTMSEQMNNSVKSTDEEKASKKKNRK